MKKILFSIFFLVFLIGIVSADYTPPGDINLRGVYAIKNATNLTSGNIVSSGNITADYFFGNASELDGVIGRANSSEFWDDYNDVNSTWFSRVVNTLTINTTSLTSFLNTWLSGKDTDDLSEGSTNLYDNQSFNQSLTDSSYAGIEWDYNQTTATYDLYNTIWSTDTDSNLSEDDVEAYVFDNDNTANLNLSSYNMTSVDCIIFISGGKICSGI